MNKCAHGVVIPERLGASPHSDMCSVCSSIKPEFDYRYGVIEKKTYERPATLNGVYDLWKADPNPDTFELLFHGTINFAMRIGMELFPNNHRAPNWFQAAEMTAIDCLLHLDQFKDFRNSYSTWVHMAVTGDLLNWYEKLPEVAFAKQGYELVSLDDPEHPVDVADTRPQPDEKLFLKEIKALLTPEERKLFEARAAGYTFREIAQEDGVHHRTIQRQWEEVENKIRAASTTKHSKSI